MATLVRARLRALVALALLLDVHTLVCTRCGSSVRGPAALGVVPRSPRSSAAALRLVAVPELEADVVELACTPEGPVEGDSLAIDTLTAQLQSQLAFLSRAGLIGVCTALSVVIFKLSIQEMSVILYEDIADALPKDPSFYWPQIVFPTLGAAGVSLLMLTYGLDLRKDIDDIARSIDAASPQSNFKPLDQLARLGAAVATLGSGCSLGPEGPAVEIGGGWSRIWAGSSTTRQQHHLLLAGTAAGVAAGFNAPFTGVIFALECGNRYLRKNTVTLTEESIDGPRSDIAAIVIAASLAALVAGWGLHEQNALRITGNNFKMQSPLFELPLYLLLGIVSGLVSSAFTSARDYFQNWFEERSQLPIWVRPIGGGLACGLVGLVYPQTLFVGYTTLDTLISGQLHLSIGVLTQLLFLKVFLSSFSLGSGLIGGVFAPSLFFGAITGTLYHDMLQLILGNVAGSFFTLSSSTTFALVGASSVLGALFRAPLTSSILMLELTQDHEAVIPVLLSSGVAGFFAEVTSSKKRGLKS